MRIQSNNWKNSRLISSNGRIGLYLGLLKVAANWTLKSSEFKGNPLLAIGTVVGSQIISFGASKARIFTNNIKLIAESVNKFEGCEIKTNFGIIELDYHQCFGIMLYSRQIAAFAANPNISINEIL